MKICPKCGRQFDRLLALSRVDNETMICDECGTMEALENYRDSGEFMACGTITAGARKDCGNSNRE